MSPPKPVILYAALPSGNSQKAILMCRLLGLPFELRAPNGLIGADAETKQSPFLRLNPLGQVPVLVDPNAAPEPASAHGFADEPADSLHCAEGLVIRDSAAILTYLALTYGNSKWLPRGGGEDDAVRSARIAQWVSYGGAEVNASLLKVRVSVLFGWDISPLTLDGALAASRATLAYLDAQLAAGAAAGRTWLVAGDSPTIADVHVFPYVAYAEDSSKGALKLESYPAVSDHGSRLSPSCRVTLHRRVWSEATSYVRSDAHSLHKIMQTRIVRHAPR